ncbi:MAG TPA: hypothetical protein VFU28_25325 [Vicinamibacterales bacterium]|nr:hypothetical protein [Vicinamibacterales bacterium]
MAGAPSPERPVVLRRLGIIKDSNDAVVQESRAQRETAEDALELFATETESSPGLGRSFNTIRSSAAATIGFVRRNALIGVIVVSATCVVAGIWAISRLVGAGASPAQSQPPVPTAADVSAAPSTDAASTASTPASSSNPTVVVNASRATNATAARSPQLARNRVQSPAAAIARPAATTPQSDRLAVVAPPAPTEAPAAAAPAAEATAAVVDDTIYSAQDRDVIPPQTDEKLPGPTISAWTTRTNAMEVIVSQTGAVERVRLVTPPVRMPDMFALSRAKVWMFKPAMKDGRPVRYRLLLTWEVNP